MVDEHFEHNFCADATIHTKVACTELHRANCIYSRKEQIIELEAACLLQDIVRQVEQGSAKVLQAVDWPQSSPDNGKDQVSEDQRRDSGDYAEPDLAGQVQAFPPCLERYDSGISLLPPTEVNPKIW